MCSPSKNNIRKGVATNVALEAGADTQITELRDTQDVGKSAARIGFFPKSSSQSSVRSNYQHPLPYVHAITSIRVNSVLGAIRSTDLAAVNPYAILNALREAELVITGNNGDNVIERVALDEVMNLEAARVTHTEVGADADGADQWVLELPTGGYFDLNQPFTLQAGDDYAAELRFEDGDGFPDPAGYEGKAFGLKVAMKAVVPAPEEG